MKILMLGWDLPPHHTGGLGIACHYLARSLANLDHKIDFVVLEDSDDYRKHDFMRVLAATSLIINDMQSISPYDTDYWLVTTEDGKKVPVGTMAELVELYTQGVIKLAKSCNFDIDIIHAHDWLTAGAAIALKRILNKPMALHVHATEYDRSAGQNGNGFVRAIEYQAVHEADVIFPVSRYTGRVLEEQYGADPSKIVVAHNAMVHSSEDKSHRLDEFGGVVRYIEDLKDRGWNILLSVGRLTMQKNLYNMMHAVRRVVEEEPKTLLVLTGTGEQRDELLALAAELGISENVIWGGWVGGDFKKKAYELSDIFLMPSASEPFGLTPLEALESGTITVLSKTSGVWEIIPSFIAVDAWDINKMSDEIVDLLRHPERRKALVEQCREELSRHDWDKVARIVTNGHKKALGEN